MKVGRGSERLVDAVGGVRHVPPLFWDSPANLPRERREKEYT